MYFTQLITPKSGLYFELEVRIFLCTQVITCNTVRNVIHANVIQYHTAMYINNIPRDKMTESEDMNTTDTVCNSVLNYSVGS